MIFSSQTVEHKVKPSNVTIHFKECRKNYSRAVLEPELGSFFVGYYNNKEEEEEKVVLWRSAADL